VQMYNLALNGYNSVLVINSISNFPADLYIYLIIDNDSEGGARGSEQPRASERRNYIATYYYVIKGSRENPLPFPDWFAESMLYLDQHPQVLMVQFEGGRLADLVTERLGIIPTSIPLYTSRVSSADPHPDAEGHRQIAASLRSYLVNSLSSYCN
jgi:hypothetical protein